MSTKKTQKCRKEERKTKKKEAEGWHGLPSESESPPSSSNRHDSISDSNSNSNGRRRSTNPNLDFEAQLLPSSSSRLPLTNLSKPSPAACIMYGARPGLHLVVIQTLAPIRRGQAIKSTGIGSHIFDA
ncbi:hypothetical protein CCUS01_08146 [Colletotrichum cuscutae]|uniref:Uncharacterized protein n=2 Tax=Colletotrichum acutatum species complex TaxID=2707335 RepID=A0AAI9YUQ2_9PEZI|nr:uncharacterized protein CCOS01_09406 [Colletotrichum costaricense]KAK1463733.1 hypothetical protein CCUS01_08146 [Colletotrichum cuscutae]KAK1524319.1 hypothetical protein CCOS01_09406 [Colletotrichum costaricense]